MGGAGFGLYPCELPSQLWGPVTREITKPRKDGIGLRAISEMMVGVDS